MQSGTISSELARVLLVDDNEGILVRAAAVLRILLQGCRSRDGWPGGDRSGRDTRPGSHRPRHLDAGVSGFEVARRLREAGSKAAVVFLTVQHGEEFLREAKAAGGIGYVVKPRLASDLKFAVQEALEGRPFTSTLR